MWDHTSCGHRDDESQEFIEQCEQQFQKKSDYLSWRAPDDLKHYHLKQLIILGYQVEDKFNRYIRCVLKAAVKLELLILFNSGSCKHCKFFPSTRFPGTEERDMIKKQISQWASPSTEIKFGILNILWSYWFCMLSYMHCWFHQDLLVY